MPDDRSQVDGARVLADLNTLRGIGAYKTGVHKPTFSEPHMRSLEWLAGRLPEAGLTATIDGIGNVLGTSVKQGPKLLAGSHLESQNYAGWLDGPLGVVYALEAARVINPDQAVNGAVEVASWCDEEGHFGSFLGSRSYVGALTEADIDAARDRNSGRTMRDALREVGLAGRARSRAARGRHIGYLEAHIEQGQTLESGGLSIGIVTSIVGIWQYRISFTGEQNHAGTTRMADRRDAGLALARFCVDIDDRFPDLRRGRGQRHRHRRARGERLRAVVVDGWRSVRPRRSRCRRNRRADRAGRRARRSGSAGARESRRLMSAGAEEAATPTPPPAGIL